MQKIKDLKRSLSECFEPVIYLRKIMTEYFIELHCWTTHIRENEHYFSNSKLTDKNEAHDIMFSWWRRRNISWKHHTNASLTCLKASQITKHNHIRLQTSIYSRSLKTLMQNVEDRKLTLHCISLWDRQSNRDHKCRDKTISAKLYELSTE